MYLAICALYARKLRREKEKTWIARKDRVKPKSHRNTSREMRRRRKTDFLARAQQEASDLPYSSLKRGETRFLRILIVQKYVLRLHNSRVGRPCAPSARSLSSGGIVLRDACYVMRENVSLARFRRRERKKDEFSKVRDDVRSSVKFTLYTIHFFAAKST